MDVMQWVLVGATVIDVGAVGVLAWLVGRSGRLRDRMLADQRATLAALRGDLGHLLEDAERRARALEQRLGVREQSLRGLMADPGRAGSGTEALPRLGIDPAEARLLRDLELSVGRQTP